MLLNRDQERSSTLELTYVLTAEEIIIKRVQTTFFSDDITRIHKGVSLSKQSQIRKLNPIVNLKGILVVGGRLVHSPMEECMKFPIILPYNSQVSTLIVRSLHARCHLGREWLFSLLRRKYWMIKARQIIYKVSKNCITCKKLFAMASYQIMADLPVSRIERSERPFTKVGVDVFGPFLVKRGRHELKRYGCIFVCFNIRAIHIELLNDLESDTFIKSLRRFIARRGTPVSIFSDNATNFRGGQTDLSKSMNLIDAKLARDYCIRRQIDWKFNIPGASHMGGVYERMIRTVRKVITGMLIDKCRLTDDILITFMYEAESIVN